MLKNYRDLKVWQKSYGLGLDLYRITKEERYGLTSQIRRWALVDSLQVSQKDMAGRQLQTT